MGLTHAGLWGNLSVQGWKYCFVIPFCNFPSIQFKMTQARQSVTATYLKKFTEINRNTVRKYTLSSKRAKGCIISNSTMQQTKQIKTNNNNKNPTSANKEECQSDIGNWKSSNFNRTVSVQVAILVSDNSMLIHEQHIYYFFFY